MIKYRAVQHIVEQARDSLVGLNKIAVISILVGSEEFGPMHRFASTKDVMELLIELFNNNQVKMIVITEAADDFMDVMDEIFTNRIYDHHSRYRSEYSFHVFTFQD